MQNNRSDPVTSVLRTLHYCPYFIPFTNEELIIIVPDNSLTLGLLMPPPPFN